MVGDTVVKHLNIVATLACCVAAAILTTHPARANQIAGQVVTGYVTAVGGDSITINGQTYNIDPGSPAADEVGSISPGQRVDIQLDGPASSPDSEVTNVAVHEGQ
jgi:hypothetical protein